VIEINETHIGTRYIYRWIRVYDNAITKALGIASRIVPKAVTSLRKSREHVGCTVAIHVCELNASVTEPNGRRVLHHLRRAKPKAVEVWIPNVAPTLDGRISNQEIGKSISVYIAYFGNVAKTSRGRV
jgi:hypothetical protein